MSLLFLAACGSIDDTQQEVVTDAPAAADAPVDVSAPAAAEQPFTVEVLRPDLVDGGTTLLPYFVNNEVGTQVVELDMTGQVVWQYDAEPGSAFGDDGSVMDATLTPDDTVLMVAKTGLVEVDRDGKVVWSMASTNSSHDVDRLDNGNTLFVDGTAEQGQGHVYEVDTDGNVVFKWDGVAAFGEEFGQIERDGWMHVNGAERLDDGRTLVTLRNFEQFAILDGQELDFVFTFGEGVSGRSVHDVSALGDGNFLAVTRNPNRAVIFDAEADEELWSWPTGGERQLTLPLEATQLGNGNILIVDTFQILEVTPDGEVAWKLVGEDQSGMQRTKWSRAFHKATHISESGAVYGN